MARFRIVIDRGLCQGHSVCLAEAPQLFRLVDTGMAYPQAEPCQDYPPAELLGTAETAAEYCPNAAITIVHEDG